MQGRPIDVSIKTKCVEMYKAGKNTKEIYNEYFHEMHPDMKLSTFQRVIQKWNKKFYADPETLQKGTYENFIAHDATVQVNGAGEITQAWIKQKANDVDWEELIEKFTDKVKPVTVKPSETCEKTMLELPLFDMHFGVAKLKDYSHILSEIMQIIEDKQREEINILIGQDLIHTNDMRGHTAHGTEIEKINVPAAWEAAWQFWCTVITAALQNSKKVKVRYSKGNHDECISWAFLKTLEAKFPNAEFDDSLKGRKIISWRNCFIGYGHCQYTNKSDELFKQFVMDFPQEFANSKVREIHTGHLHRESVDCGFMVRRLASAVPVDEWHDENGYVTAHKRFQLFEWEPGRLKTIYYL